jgi:hypothetical protein
MRNTKSTGLVEIGQSLEKDLEASIRALTPASAAPHRPESSNGEMSGDNLAALLRQVSEASTREVETLIDELHEIRKGLEDDAERIQNEIVKYAELSQGLRQLTAIISDNIKTIPSGDSNLDS